MNKFITAASIALAGTPLLLGVTTVPAHATAYGTFTTTEYNNIYLGETKSAVESAADVQGTKLCGAGEKQVGSDVTIVVTGYRYSTTTVGKYVFIQYKNASNDGWNRVAKTWWRSTVPADLCDYPLA